MAYINNWIRMKKRVFLWGMAALLCLNGCSAMEDSDAERMETFCDEIKVFRDGGENLDFDVLRDINPDIHAWLEIPGTNVDYPVLQNPSDDEMYLYTACDNREYIGGSLFTQASYNAADFSDPVTVIYGNAMWDGTMFGELQKNYSGKESAETYGEITVYLPEEVRQYTVFAFVPYDSTHILYTYDFANEYWYGNFFSNVKKIRSIGAYFNEEIAPEYGDRVIILSTSLNDNSEDGRFLVMAVCHDAIAGNSSDAP